MKQPDNSEEKTGSCNLISEAEIDEALEESFPNLNSALQHSPLVHVKVNRSRFRLRRIRELLTQT